MVLARTGATGWSKFNKKIVLEIELIIPTHLTHQPKQFAHTLLAIPFCPQLTPPEGPYHHSLMKEQHMPDGNPSMY